MIKLKIEIYDERTNDYRSIFKIFLVIDISLRINEVIVMSLDNQ